MLEPTLKLKLGGLLFSVVEDDPTDWAPNTMGRMHSARAQILLRADLPEDVKMETLLHEIVHAITDMYGLAVANDEAQISVLSQSLFAFMRDNPEVVVRMCGMAEVRHG